MEEIIFSLDQAYGSQVDVRVMNSIQEETRYDLSFDLEYESSGSISGSYVIEMKIPFSSLPFLMEKIKNGNLVFLENIMTIKFHQ